MSNQLAERRERPERRQLPGRSHPPRGQARVAGPGNRATLASRHRSPRQGFRRLELQELPETTPVFPEEQQVVRQVLGLRMAAIRIRAIRCQC